MGRPPQYVRLGIGDDCAALDLNGMKQILFASDMLMDQVHFDLKRLGSARLAGRKALAVNLSDIAAMAGMPLCACVSLALPKKNGGRIGREVMTGIKQLAKDFHVAIVGGDTNTWDGPLVINIAILGRQHPRGVVTRAGAKPGDLIFVSGKLGGSIFGKHLRFTPQLKLATWLQTHFPPHAMIDLSDGIAQDLRHILDESNCSAELNLAKLPLSPAVRKFKDQKSPTAHVLSDGEDFELCFTLSARQGQKLMTTAHYKKFGLSCIGQITRSDRKKSEIFVREKTGRRRPLTLAGFEHQFSNDGRASFRYRT